MILHWCEASIIVTLIVSCWRPVHSVLSKHLLGPGHSHCSAVTLPQVSATKHCLHVIMSRVAGEHTDHSVRHHPGPHLPRPLVTMILPGYQTCNSASSSNFHHLALLALLVALVSHSSNFHHWPLLALLMVLVLH